MTPAENTLTFDALARFRAALAGCETVALVDTAAGTVLAADSVSRPAQEALDALCGEAAQVLAVGRDRPRWAIETGPLGCRLYLRSPQAPDEVLVCVLAPGTPVAAARASGTRLLEGP